MAQLQKTPLLARNLRDGNNVSLVGKDPVRAVTGAADTFVAADKGRTVTRSNAGASTQTIPTNAVVPMGIGDELNVVNLGAGKLTINGAGTVIENAEAGLVLYQHGWAKLLKIAVNTWAVMGSGLNAS